MRLTIQVYRAVARALNHNMLAADDLNIFGLISRLIEHAQAKAND